MAFVESICLTCNKVFYKKSLKAKGKYCNPLCIRYSGPIESLRKYKGRGFWQTATEEEKRLKIKSEFHRLVIKKDGCWGWKTVPLNSGYGVIRIGDAKVIIGHRASWMIHNGSIPHGLFVCHRCDNPICTNPEHLFLGTPKENTKDCIDKKRRNAPFGLNHHNAKLSEEQVIEIKKLITLKISQSKIANRFKVSPSAIQNIADGKTWKHL